MKKGQITEQMLKRFPKIAKFIKNNKRLPTNFEVGNMFKIPVGQTTINVVNSYNKSLTHCELCGHKK